MPFLPLFLEQSSAMDNEKDHLRLLSSLYKMAHLFKGNGPTLDLINKLIKCVETLSVARYSSG